MGSRNKKYTLEEIIEKANKKHNNFYSYNKFVYNGIKEKGIIICPLHGEFLQSMSAHTNGRGCKECGNIHSGNLKRGTLENFISRAIQKHGNKYDYSKFNYINVDTKGIIICPIHGEFYQSPYTHLKCGCDACGGTKTIETEEWIRRFKMIHGDSHYDYSEVGKIIRNTTKVKIKCLIHNCYFYAKPTDHIYGDCCKQCRYQKVYDKCVLSREEIINRFEIIYGNLYDYSKFNYINYNEKSIIVCHKHGNFLKSAAKHLDYQGCPNCKLTDGEYKIRSYLVNNNLFFDNKIGQIMFDDCKNPLTNRKLRFDFLVYNTDNSIKLIIEFDGPDHFLPLKKLESTNPKRFNFDNYMYSKFKDIIKNNYCKMKGIKLIRIPYWNFQNIESILTKELNLERKDNG